MSTEHFDFQPRTRIVFGRGVVSRLGEIARELDARRALVVSDPGVVAAGHTERCLDSLRAAGLESFLFDRVEENPTTAHVAAGVDFARGCRPDLIVGAGGGSSMDCAKGINFVHSSGGDMRDYWGVGKAKGPLLPMVAVPTTAGTGSDMQSFALIVDAETHQKMACGDPRAACRVALLDPELTVSQPTHVTAATGLDAIAHAVETLVSKRRNALSSTFSREAWRLLDEHFEKVLEVPEDIEARAAMQLGSSLAGAAIELSMLGAAHAAANPLTARFGVVHGGAVGLLLPHVVRANRAVAEDSYAGLVRCSRRARTPPTGEALALRLEELLAKSRLPVRLSEWGVDRNRLEEMSEEASRQWTARFNPRALEPEDYHQLYENAF